MNKEVFFTSFKANEKSAIEMLNSEIKEKGYNAFPKQEFTEIKQFLLSEKYEYGKVDGVQCFYKKAVPVLEADKKAAAEKTFAPDKYEKTAKKISKYITGGNKTKITYMLDSETNEKLKDFCRKFESFNNSAIIKAVIEEGIKSLKK